MNTNNGITIITPDRKPLQAEIQRIRGALVASKPTKPKQSEPIKVRIRSF